MFIHKVTIAEINYEEGLAPLPLLTIIIVVLVVVVSKESMAKI